MSMKVRELAKELGISSEVILDQLHKLYVDVEDQNSKIDDKIVGLIRIKLGASGAAKAPVKKTGKAKTAVPLKSKAPKAAKKTKVKTEEGEKKRKKEKTKPQAKEEAKKKAAEVAGPEIEETEKTAKLEPEIEKPKKAAPSKKPPAESTPYKDRI